MSESLTEPQKEVLERLPDTRRSISDDLGISLRAVRYRMGVMEDRGYNFSRDEDGVWYRQSNFEEREDEPKRVDSYEKAQATKKIHNQLTELEQEVKESLNNTEPVRNTPERNSDSSTLVLPHSDSHVGAVVEDRYDVDFYSVGEARDAISEYFDRGIDAAQRRGDVEDVAVVLNGDHVDGEGIFPAQRHEQQDNLREQIRKAGTTYINQILKLSERFEFVDVFCVPGNHGRLDRNSTTNADNILYDIIEIGLCHSDVDNVNVEKAGAGGFLNFDIRGWTYHARHGQDYLKHIGTSSGIRRALQWKTQYDFDVGIRSHYHSIKYESISDETPIIMTGSTAPPSTFAESNAASGGECGVFWFTTEDNAIENFQPIRFGR